MLTADSLRRGPFANPLTPGGGYDGGLSDQESSTEQVGVEGLVQGICGRAGQPEVYVLQDQDSGSGIDATRYGAEAQQRIRTPAPATLALRYPVSRLITKRFPPESCPLR
jgi:hypothetical protein